MTYAKIIIIMTSNTKHTITGGQLHIKAGILIPHVTFENNISSIRSKEANGASGSNSTPEWLLINPISCAVPLTNKTAKLL